MASKSSTVHEVPIITQNILERNVSIPFGVVSSGTSVHAVVVQTINPQTDLAEKKFKAGNKILDIGVPQSLEVGTEVVITFDQKNSEIIARIRVLSSNTNVVQDTLRSLLSDKLQSDSDAFEKQIALLRSTFQAEGKGEALDESVKSFLALLKSDSPEALKVFLSNSSGELLQKIVTVLTDLSTSIPLDSEEATVRLILQKLQDYLVKTLSAFPSKTEIPRPEYSQTIPFPKELEEALNNITSSTPRVWLDATSENKAMSIKDSIRPMLENQLERVVQRIAETALEIKEVVKALERNLDRNLDPLMQQIKDNVRELIESNPGGPVLDRVSLEKTLHALPDILNSLHDIDSGFVVENYKDSSRLKAHLYLLHAELLLALTTPEEKTSATLTPQSNQEIILKSLPEIQKIIESLPKHLNDPALQQLTQALKVLGTTLPQQTQRIDLFDSLKAIQSTVTSLLASLDALPEQKSAKIQKSLPTKAPQTSEELVKELSLAQTKETVSQLRATAQLLQSYEMTKKLSSLFDVLGEPTFILFPTLFQGMLSKAEVSWQRAEFPEAVDDRPRRKGKRSSEHVLSLKAKLPNLGDVGVTLRYAETKVDIRFSVTQAHSQKKIAEELPILFERLRGLGFSSVEGCAVVERISSIQPQWVSDLFTSSDIIA